MVAAVDINDSKDEKFGKVQTINIIITGTRRERERRAKPPNNVKFSTKNVFKGESTSTTKRS